LELEYEAIFIEIECKIFKISKGKRMILCAPCTQGWHGLIKKVLMFHILVVGAIIHVQMNQEGVAMKNIDRPIVIEYGNTR
jgi:hypothetical protein